MGNVVTLGEIMLRLSPPGQSRIFQAQSMDVNYGGAEANVAVSLAQFGHKVSFVSKAPDNALGDAAVGVLKKYNVDCSHMVRGGERLGIYFLENGASVRPSSVVYDRKYSSFSKMDSDELDFDKIFHNVDLFHISGITPVLSHSCARLSLETAKAAKAHGVTVSLDLNYRKRLWEEHVEEKQQVMAKLASYADICFGNVLDGTKCLGWTKAGEDFLSGPFESCVSRKNMETMRNAYGFTYLVSSLRESISASDNGWSGEVCWKDGFYTGRKYMLHITDRVGGGDAFAAGFLHGILEQMLPSQALEFALAAAAIKHTIPGDLNITSVHEVKALMDSDGAGRVVR